MKVCYVYIEKKALTKHPSSVLVRVIERAHAARHLPIDFIIFNPTVSKKSGNLHFFRLPLQRVRPLAAFLNRWSYLALVSKTRVLETYDVIILRYPLVYGFGSLRFFKKLSPKVVTEHHTNELAELRLAHRKIPIRSFLEYFLEKTMRGRCLEHVAGIIGVTSEIVNISSAGMVIDHKHVVSNGINFSLHNYPRSEVPASSEPIKIVFVASRFRADLGLDRLLRSFQTQGVNRQIELILVGKVFRKDDIDALNRLDRTNTRVKMMGLLSGDAYERVMRSVHIGVSCLALFRKGLAEACPLKTREYLARGIPFVYGYRDPDLAENESYALRVSNDNTDIDVERLLEFALEVGCNTSTRGDMVTYAKQNLSWQTRMESLYCFSKTVRCGIRHSQDDE